jgi:hypothetical protein
MLLVLAFITAFALVATPLYILRAPIRSAAKIELGDNAAAVHGLLGEPDAVFETTAELQASSLVPMSYVFAERNSWREVALHELPPVVTRAEWFEFDSGTAGHLVYFDENGVTNVFWGGT